LHLASFWPPHAAVNTSSLENIMSAESHVSSGEAHTNESLVADFKAVVSDAEDLLRATAGQTGEKVAESRSRIQHTLQRAKASLHEAQLRVVRQAKAAGQATDAYVHENPWKSVGVAAGVGLVIGLLIGRR
jgi:ElaB/YqjD/DUF883 family membrane-anchored ribosome-binding protein